MLMENQECASTVETNLEQSYFNDNIFCTFDGKKKTFLAIFEGSIEIEVTIYHSSLCRNSVSITKKNTLFSVLYIVITECFCCFLKACCIFWHLKKQSQQHQLLLLLQQPPRRPLYERCARAMCTDVSTKSLYMSQPRPWVQKFENQNIQNSL